MKTFQDIILKDGSKHETLTDAVEYLTEKKFRELAPNAVEPDNSEIPSVEDQKKLKDELDSKKKIHYNATAPRDKHKTKQDYGTPDDFFGALNAHFGFKWDLACTNDNKLTVFGLTPSDDSLKCKWHELEGYLFLNPPFADIEPWARKCYEEMQVGAKIVLLTPASVGSNWFRDWVFNKAKVRFLNGRLTFKGQNQPYPKDCMISIFDGIHTGFDIWDWRKGWY